MSRFILFLTCVALSFSVSIVQAREVRLVAEDVFEHIVSPGALNPGHAKLQGVSQCGACHSMTAGVSQEKCLNCHKDIARRLAAKIGYHGTFDRQCLRCHTGHRQDIIRFEPQAFNHNLSQFPLTGKHTTLECIKCHQRQDEEGKALRFTYQNLPVDCAGCHQNIHTTKAMGECQSCHQTSTWRLDSFAHAEKTSFPLRGLHKITDCKKCHTAMEQPVQETLKFKIEGYDSCLTCHKDTHKGKLTDQCLTCHTMTGWRGVNLFQHDTARFTLVGKHQGVKCGQCHKDNQFKGLKFNDCSDCHKGKTAHKDRITGCKNCHSPESWSVLKSGWQDDPAFHQQLHYKLKGAHAKVACDKCHSKGEAQNYFNLKSTDCDRCHADPHKGALQRPCQSCHVETAFKDHALFDHQEAAFKLDDRHKKIACAVCHTHKSFKQAPVACGDCHIEVTKFARGIWGDRWRSGRIVSPKARIVQCKDCHGPSSAKVDGKACLGCHGEPYGEFFTVRSALIVKAIDRIRLKLDQAAGCAEGSGELFKRITDQLNFLEKNYYHNYRLADQALKDMDLQLSEVIHANCQK